SEGGRQGTVLAAGPPAGMHEPLRAATDGAEQRAHLHLAGLGRGDRLLVQLGAAGTDIPERLALHLRHSLGCHSPWTMPLASPHPVHIKSSTRDAFRRIGLGRLPLYPQTPEKTPKALACLNVPPATRSGSPRPLTCPRGGRGWCSSASEVRWP